MISSIKMHPKTPATARGADDFTLSSKVGLVVKPVYPGPQSFAPGAGIALLGLIVAFTGEDANVFLIVLLVAWVMTSDGTKVDPPP
jgi:hypothetical protein